ncbi:MAG: CHRD domain-containing protein, partial [Woeseiaceae bacterium]
MNSCRGLPTRGLLLLAFLSIAGCGGGGYGDSSPPPPPADTTAPTVSAVQAPAGTVNRTATLSVTASDNVGVAMVRFFVDGTLLASDNTAPFSVDWDTSGETEGDHVLHAEAEDAAGNMTRSADATVTVRNMVQFDVVLSGEEEVPPTGSQATAQATLIIHLVTGAVEGELTINGLTATAAHIHDAFAGVNGSILVPLDQDPGDPSRFTVPAGAMLDGAGVDLLLAAALYVNVHTAANPGGEIRGQILPEGFVLRFTDLAGAGENPRVDTPARGRAAVTLDTASGALVVQAQVEGLDDANVAHVHEAYAGANGPVLVPLSKDPMDSGRWFVENGMLNAAGLDAYAAGRLYVNVHSPANPGGEIRGQIIPEGITLLLAELSGAQEVPAVDTRADGLAALTLDEANALLTLHLNTRRLDDAIAAHLHSAYAGVNGDIAFGLIQDGSNPAHWFAEEQTLTQAQLDALLAGATYVNAHNPANPAGHIRGQVIPERIVFAFGRLEGDQEVPPVASAAGGTFAVTVDPDALTLVAHANTTGADDAVAAHLHDAYAGTNGGVIIPLAQEDPNNAAHWSAVGQAIDANQLAAIRAGRYYANVHTPAN